MEIIRNEKGKLFESNNFCVVKLCGEKGELINRHNHKGMDVFFNVIKGSYEIKINEEINILTSGNILKFDGDNYISATLLEDSEAIVYLIKK